ncbi:MarR family transcriptional regulator [Vibrio harveyi]|uniref:MarR family transcriptional regulator n=1 Tax=Vibrio harveyi TaxID=669 RepID=UPI001EFD0F1E|nr:MarR family transcriptional regulator [Vibrio harveyi]MCG9237099.1 MarR family transcriptional regulator [Vibrio harveyi]MCG9585616.1 MarR family transcriptional regulator [Vibrio harveyi]CAH1209759.1 MarR family transcriptional regulator [Vibrio harveyi]CAH1560462.1 MarR family transcriptional regulator [Vibrio harveyi]CAH1566215.1 MarR family transcriptional regulator [Vibrio harveyi]
MRLAHKRKVQMKLQKRIKATVANVVAAPKAAKPVVEKAAAPSVTKKAVAEKAVAEKKVAAAKTVEVALTPKQQQVLDIVVANAEGINPKGIGLAAGQEDTKAASWATGALKKLLEENLVQKEQLAGNKVIYKAV